jgi:hypothetical protein
MIRAVCARRSRAFHAVGALAAVATTVVVTSTAAVAMPVAAPARATGRSLPTLFEMTRVYSTPAMRSDVRGKVTSSGTGVDVACWTSGSNYKNSTVWYQITSPMAGYISAFNLAAHFAPAAHVPHCLLPSFHARYFSLERDLHIRKGPTISSDVSGLLGNIGSMVVVTCYKKGTAIFNDKIWYRTKSPDPGYVSGRLLNTGHDPAPGVPHC